ncbi:alpha/beta hydrolase [Halomonas shantousis]
MTLPDTDMLLLPGLLCDDAVWAGQVERLTSLRCRISDYGEADSIEAMAELVLRQAPSRFVLAGHSMGGRVALEIYRRAPQRVTHLILLDTGFRSRPDDETGTREEQARMALLAQAREHGMRTMGEAWLQGMVHPDRLKDEALLGSVLKMIECKTPAVFAAQIQALLGRPDATPVLESIRCPTLLICGRQDTWSPLSRHEEMAELIPNSRLVVIEEAGHMSPMERPEAVASAIHHWLEEQ